MLRTYLRRSSSRSRLRLDRLKCESLFTSAARLIVPSSVVPSRHSPRNRCATLLLACAGLLALLMAACKFGWVPPLWVQYVPFIVSILLFGLPDGALDHLVMLCLRQLPVTLKLLLRVICHLHGASITTPGAAPMLQPGGIAQYSPLAWLIRQIV